MNDNGNWETYYISGVQAAYWGMLDEGRINQTSASLLMQSVDEAIDLAPTEPLCDWKGLKAYVNFPSYYRFLQTGLFPRKLVTYFTVERLESACYICAAFLRAHRIAQQQLHDFIGKVLLWVFSIFFNSCLQLFLCAIDVKWIIIVFYIDTHLEYSISLLTCFSC